VADNASQLSRVAATLQKLNLLVGNVVAWLTVAMVLVVSVIVIDRYWFASGSIRVQESVSFMHAAVFMLAAAWTLARGGHVRVDIFYSSMSPRGKAIVDITGTLLLLVPFCLFLIWTSWDYVATSWAIGESSLETGGLPFPFPAIMKSFIPLSAGLLLLQGIVMILFAIATLISPATSTAAGKNA